MSLYDPYYPGDALIGEANAFRELASGPVGAWVIANAHDIVGLSDFTLRAIRKVRDNGHAETPGSSAQNGSHASGGES